MIGLEAIVYLGALGLVVIGVAGMVLCRHLFRLILALALAETGANLLLVLAGLHPNGVAPILLDGRLPGLAVDPVPQAMVLTSIVIGVGVQALAVALAIRAHRMYRTLDMPTLRSRMEQDIASAAGVAPPQSQQAPVGERPLPAAGARP